MLCSWSPGRSVAPRGRCTSTGWPRRRLPVLAPWLPSSLAFAVHPHGRAGLDAAATYAGLAVVMLVLADVLCGPLRAAPRGPRSTCSRASLPRCAASSPRSSPTGTGSWARSTNADTFAFFLVAAVPLVGTVRTSSQQPVWWVWACFATLILAGLGTQSRPAFVALLAMVLVAVATGLLALRHAGALIAVVTTGVALVIAVLPLSFGQAITDPQRLSDTNIAQRNDLRLAAVEMTRHSPVVGLGPAAFLVLHQDYRRVGAVERDLDTAYSTALEASAELGLLGLAALYAVWLVPAAAARRRWRRDRSPLVAGALLALAGLLTASLLESEQGVLALWFLAAMAVALGRPARVRTPMFPASFDARSSGQVGVRS